MKPVYQCDYCGKMAPKEEMRVHETKCYCNPERKTCYSCKHRVGVFSVKCQKEHQVDSGKIMQYCTDWEQGEVINVDNEMEKYKNFFGGAFG